MRRPFEPHAAHHHRLARRAAGGERGAFVELYRALYPPVARHVACRVATAADAEDVVARTFHRLLGSLPGLDPSRGTVLSWCLATARNLATDVGRARRPGQKLSPEALARAIEAELRTADPDARVEVQVERGEGREEVRVRVTRERKAEAPEAAPARP